MVSFFLQALLPIFINPSSGDWTTDKISFGAMGDSYFEYLLKVLVESDVLQ